jgi:hypothetical protein
MKLLGVLLSQLGIWLQELGVYVQDVRVSPKRVILALICLVASVVMFTWYRVSRWGQSAGNLWVVERTAGSGNAEQLIVFVQGWIGTPDIVRWLSFAFWLDGRPGNSFVGTWGNSDALLLKGALNTDTWSVAYANPIEDTQGGIADHANFVISRLRDGVDGRSISTYSKVAFLAHSTGGVISRRILIDKQNDKDFARVGMLVEFESPNNGVSRVPGFLTERFGADLGKDLRDGTKAPNAFLNKQEAQWKDFQRSHKEFINVCYYNPVDSLWILDPVSAESARKGCPEGDLGQKATLHTSHSAMIKTDGPAIQSAQGDIRRYFGCDIVLFNGLDPGHEFPHGAEEVGHSRFNAFPKVLLFNGQNWNPSARVWQDSPDPAHEVLTFKNTGCQKKYQLKVRYGDGAMNPNGRPSSPLATATFVLYSARDGIQGCGMSGTGRLVSKTRQLAGGYYTSDSTNHDLETLEAIGDGVYVPRGQYYLEICGENDTVGGGRVLHSISGIELRAEGEETPDVLDVAKR